MKPHARLRLTRAIDAPSALVAITLTLATFAAVFAVSARTLMFRSAAPRADRMTLRETLVYLDRPSDKPRAEPTIAPLERRAAGPRTRPPATRAEPVPPSERRAPNEPSPAPTSNSLAGPTPVFLPPYRPQSRSTPSPFDKPRLRNPFLSEEPRTRAELDSILAVMNQGIPLFARTRTPTVAERDSLMQDAARARLVPGRAQQIPGTANMSINVPLLSKGPSSAERRRDSAANAEYVGRLRRLQARVSASRESLRVADSMSRGRAP